MKEFLKDNFQIYYSLFNEKECGFTGYPTTELNGKANHKFAIGFGFSSIYMNDAFPISWKEFYTLSVLRWMAIKIGNKRKRLPNSIYINNKKLVDSKIITHSVLYYINCRGRELYPLEYYPIINNPDSIFSVDNLGMSNYYDKEWHFQTIVVVSSIEPRKINSLRRKILRELKDIKNPPFTILKEKEKEIFLPYVKPEIDRKLGIIISALENLENNWRKIG
jgi:hypothetical protein